MILLVPLHNQHPVSPILSLKRFLISVFVLERKHKGWHKVLKWHIVLFKRYWVFSSWLCGGCFWKYVLWGCMFAYIKTWHHWQPQSEHNTEVMCHFLCPVSALPELVLSKGHHIEEVSELPLVNEDKVKGYQKTKETILLKKLRVLQKNTYTSQQMIAVKAKWEAVTVSSTGGPVSSRPSETFLQ